MTVCTNSGAGKPVLRKPQDISQVKQDQTTNGLTYWQLRDLEDKNYSPPGRKKIKNPNKMCAVRHTVESLQTA